MQNICKKKKKKQVQLVMAEPVSFSDEVYVKLEECKSEENFRILQSLVTK